MVADPGELTTGPEAGRAAAARRDAAVAGLGPAARWVPPHRAHGVWAAVVVAVVLGCAWPSASDSVLAVAGTAVALVAAGLLLLRPRWYAGTVAVAWCGWAAVTLAAGASTRSDGYDAAVVAPVAAGMLVATAVGAYLRGVRLRDLAVLDALARAASAAAVRDELTGVANGRGLSMMAGQILESARRGGDAVHCIFLDVTALGVVNDALGREAGDDVLAAVADALTRSVRATDVVARWHGDDFCVVGPGAGMPPIELERRVRDRLIAEPPVDPQTWSPEVNAGGSMLAPWDSGTLETLLSQGERELEVRRQLRRDRSARRAPQRRAADVEPDGAAEAPGSPQDDSGSTAQDRSASD